MKPFQFTFENIKTYYLKIIKSGYKIITCKEYPKYKKINSADKIFVNRIDIDVSMKKGLRLAKMFNEMAIPATFFIRLHANEYNPFSFENYRILKYIRDSGHEIGYHSEVIDQSIIWQESAEDCLRRDIDILNRLLTIQIAGVASHSGATSLNNLDFWKDKKPSDFGLLYEAYDQQPDFDLFNNAFYISDSSWTYWKCYKNGRLCEGDQRTLGEHTDDGHKLIYCLIHPETYYDQHFYE